MNKAPTGFPTKVRLFSQDWAVVYCQRVLEGGLLGSSIGSRREIILCTQQTRDSMIDTLVHECLHSYLRMLPGFSDGDTSSTFAGAEHLEEGIVTGLTSAMIDLLRANPKILALVTE